MAKNADAVTRQYEDYPYPPRHPAEEKKRLLAPITECLDHLNHYGFGGCRDFTKGFRALVAGSGTGDSAIFLAEQLRHSKAEIVCLDISEPSISIARQRAKVRGLDNIKWQLASLLDIEQLSLGKFDYINCTGVLHHLPDPDAGLAALHSVLAKDGVMGLMVYGEYARTGVYQMQTLMRLIHTEKTDAAEKIADCKTLLKQLPPSNWFNRGQELFNDLSFGDAGLYDLLLHSCDRAFTVPRLFDFLAKQGLVINAFVQPYLYRPEYYISDKTLLKKIASLDRIRQYAIGELLGGIIKMHTFYATNTHQPPPGPNELDMVPCLPVNTDRKTYTDFYRLVKDKKNEASVSFKHEGRDVQLTPSAELTAALKYMDGHRTLEEIFHKASLTGKIKKMAVQGAFSKFYQTLSDRGLIFLRHRNVPYYQTVNELQASTFQNK